MKNIKERQFVKKVNENLKEEVNTSKIIILETSKVDNQIDYVMYEDRFGRQYQVYYRNGQYKKEEYK